MADRLKRRKKARRYHFRKQLSSLGMGEPKKEAGGIEASQLQGGVLGNWDSGLWERRPARWCCVSLSSEEGPRAWQPGGCQSVDSAASEGREARLMSQVLEDLETGNLLGWHWQKQKAKLEETESVFLASFQWPWRAEPNRKPPGKSAMLFRSERLWLNDRILRTNTILFRGELPCFPTKHPEIK